MIRVRFAPSPTGHLHIGGVRSAIFNWLFARHNNGTYLLRVEDTDVLRSRVEYVNSQLNSLTWLGLLPDEPIVYQMERIAEHTKAAHQLMAEGKAYPCFCVPRDADAVVAELDQGQGSSYNGTCRDKAYTQEDLATKPYAIRFKIPNDVPSVTFYDLILGPITVERDTLDDFIIVRRDGTPIYNFCVVVDDIAMNISHVIRGQDHISNTHKQYLYYQALGAIPPQFAHIPLILGPSGGKLSKRDASVSVEEYRAQGFLPDALFNYLVRLGWSHGDQEVFTRAELVSFFTLANVGKKGSIFDMKKLLWLNALYMRQTKSSELLDHMEVMNKAYADELCSQWSEADLMTLIDQYKQRSSTLVELYEGIKAFAKSPSALDVALIAKWRTETTKDLVSAFADCMAVVMPFNHDTLLAAANRVCDEHATKLVNLAQPLRLALTGSVTSPSVFDLIAVIGKERAQQRIQELVKIL